MFIIKILLLVGLIRVLQATNSPFLCSTIYAGFGFFLGFLWADPMKELIIATFVAFAISSIYFWLLDKFESAGILWWLIMAGGFAIGFV